ncbi:hypothetical protein C0J52_23287 [Blattella germanica]|nr:hypothetical protein C0J52_23287 [Blattella germanica]
MWSTNMGNNTTTKESPTGHSEKDGKEDIADINTRPDKKHRSQEKNISERCSDHSATNEMEMG